MSATVIGVGGEIATPDLFDTIQIVPKTDISQATSIAEIAVPTGSTIHKKDDLLLVVLQNLNEVSVSAWDLSDPTSPELKDTLTTDSIPVIEYSNDYGDGGYNSLEKAVVTVVGNALVFQVDKRQSKDIGTIHKTTYSVGMGDSECSSNGDVCTYIWGWSTCQYLKKTDGAKTPTSCEDNFKSCTEDAEGDEECDNIPAPDLSKLKTETNIRVKV